MSEVRKPVEGITPDKLISDNRSERAVKGITLWYQAKTQRRLTGVISCSDARVSTTTAFNTPAITAIRTVAAGNVRDSEDPMRWVYEHDGAMRFIVLEHFDGQRFHEGEPPQGCGGLGEKGKVIGEKPFQSGEVISALDYVRCRIDHPDLVMQALITASRLTRLTNAPVLAAAIDHRTYQVYPLAMLSGDNFQSPIRLADLIDYNPGKLYAYGLPTLDMSYTPGPFSSLIDANYQVVQRLAQNPDFFDSQKVQNPTAVVISTEIRPAGARYPETFGKPNTGFMVRVPYVKGDQGVRINDIELAEAFAQAHYALGMALSAKPGESFFDTRHMLVETPSMDLTRYVIGELEMTDLYRNWAQKKNGTLIGAQVNKGVTTDIALF